MNEGGFDSQDDCHASRLHWQPHNLLLSKHHGGRLFLGIHWPVHAADQQQTAGKIQLYLHSSKAFVA